jgi:hypothetical protein
MNLRTIGLAGLCILVSACAHTSPRYAPSANNQERLRQMSANLTTKVGTNKFTAVEPGKTSILCRAAGPIQAPDGKAFEDYLQESFVNELKMSGIYSESTPLKLSGNLDSIDFSSNIGAGKWAIRMTFSGENISPFTVENTYQFSTNFVADIACEQVAQALPAATQDFIAKVIEHPEFQKYIANKNIARLDGAAPKP